MSGKISPNRILRALRHRGYAIFTAGNLSSMSGEWVQRVGIGWLVWEMTHSASWLGIIACADMLPAVLISPLAGAYSDRMNRLRFVKMAVNLSALQPFVLTLLFFTGLLDIWLILLLALYNGVVGALRQSSWHTVIPYLVDRESLAPAVALGSVTFNLFPDATVTGVIEHVETSGDSVSWSGRLDGVELGTFSMVHTAGVFMAHVASPRGVYEVTVVDGDRYRVVQIDQTKFPGGRD